MSCPSGKRTYRDPFTAERMVQALEDLKGHRTRAYRCECGNWHLTSQVWRDDVRPRTAS